jgi:hypothetical protein
MNKKIIIPIQPRKPGSLLPLPSLTRCSVLGMEAEVQSLACEVDTYYSCRTSLFRDSFFNRIVFLWNGLPADIRGCSVISSFERNLYTHYFSKLHSTFDVNRMRTWKTYCSKCRSYNLLELAARNLLIIWSFACLYFIKYICIVCVSCVVLFGWF